MTSDHPLYAVFNKQGARTYVAYNMTNAPITVAFSDGAVVNVPANAFSSGNGAGGDTQAPTAPSGLTSPSKNSSSITLSWNASTDNVAVSGYRIYRGGAGVATSSSTTFTDTGLSAGTSYTYTVRAIPITLPNVPGGASVVYRFTIGLAAGGATETAWVTFIK